MTETPPDDIKANATLSRRAPRWMWIILVVSVSLNLLVIGMAAAAFVHYRKGHGGAASGLARFIETLPSDRQSKLRAVLDERRQLIRPLRRTLRDARRRARDAFVAEPFNRDVLVEAYADAAEARMALTTARQNWFENLASLLTAEERRKFLKMRHDRRGRRWRRHRSKDGER